MDITDFSTPVRPPRAPPSTYPTVIPQFTFDITYAVPSVVSTTFLNVKLVGLLRFPKILASLTRVLGLAQKVQSTFSILYVRSLVNVL